MCRFASRTDLARSRIRWYDLPALLTLHRPWRCRICGERSYGLAFGRFPVLPQLWMHVAACLLLLGAVGYFATQGDGASLLSKGTAMLTGWLPKE